MHIASFFSARCFRCNLWNAHMLFQCPVFSLQFLEPSHFLQDMISFHNYMLYARLKLSLSKFSFSREGSKNMACCSCVESKTEG